MLTVSWKNIIGALYFLGLFLPTLSATHIIGGEMNYACLGNDRYEISLTVYRDCYLGEAPMDDTAYVAVYDQLGVLLQTIPILLERVTEVIQPENCLLVPPTICVETTTYVDTVSLSLIAGGYHIAYQRCCRNATIQNIVDPLNTGATYDIILSEKAMRNCNSSPIIQAWPPTFICSNRPLLFDHSAIDREGDSLVYSLCTPVEGGISLINPRPRPAFPPPYKAIRWKTPTYGLDNVLGGIPLSIDPSTGMLTGIPNTIGQFVVGICIEEYRNGQLLSTTKRDFQYNVIPCQEIAAAFQLAEQQCNNLVVQPVDQSIGSNSYTWKVLQKDEVLMTSQKKRPSFTLSQNGLYTIHLIINDKEACIDSVEHHINLKGQQLPANFDYQLSGCVDDLQLLMNSSSNDAISSWTVQGEKNQLTAQDAQTLLPIQYEPILNIELIVLDEDGCSSQIDSVLFLPPPPSIETAFDWEVDNCQNNSFDLSITNHSITNGHPYIWKWSLSDGQESINKEPVFSISKLEELKLSLTAISKMDSTCMQQITQVIPAQQYAAELTISEDFLLCEEETPLTLYAFGNQIAKQWWLHPNGDTLGYDTELVPSTKEDIRYKVELEDSLGCVHARTVEVKYHPLEVTYEPIKQICIGYLDTLIIHTPFSATYQWYQEGIPIEESSNRLAIQPIQSTIYQFEVVQEGGCSQSGEIVVEVSNNTPQVEIIAPSPTLAIGNTMQLQASYHPSYNYQWSPSELIDDPSSHQPTITPLENTLFQVTVTNQEGCTAAASIVVSVTDIDCAPPYVFIPNAFTPNGNGENDQLFVRGTSIKNMQLIIYDRWGDKIFESNQQELGWDGTKAGIPQPAGVFGYFLFVGCYNEGEYYQQGNITLIR